MPKKMHNYKRLPTISMGRKALGAAVASTFLMLASNANATGLGRLTVLSSLGQPLRAEIELTSPNKEDIASLAPKVASPEAFKQASIEFNPALLSLRFNIEPRGSGYVIRLTSTQSMNEPFVDLLLELNSNNGRLIREYTFLLDPVELRTAQSAQVSAPANVVSAAPQPVQAHVAQPASRPIANASAEPKEKKISSKKVEPSRELSGDTYKVKSGDTLNKIAANFRSEGVSLDQLLVSFYRANPDAFVGNNINRLKAGQILNVPDQEAIRATSNGEAHSVVMAHAADFNAYRNKLAGQVETAPIEKARESKQVASGTISTKVNQAPNAANDSVDKLRLSKVAPSASAKSATGKAVADEDKIAKEKAIAEANARVKELEKNVNELNKILQIKDKELADKQALAAKVEQKAAEQKAAEQKAAEDKKNAQAAKASASAAADASVPVVASKSVEPIPASATTSQAPEAASAPVEKPVQPVKKRKVIAPPPPPPETSFIDELLGSSFLLPLGALVLVVLGGLGIWSAKRKKKLQQFEDSILTGSSMKANSMFGSTGGQSIDTNNSVFNSNFAPSASQLDANEVDPVAEADVYIAYGRDSQAEEILKEALRTQPDRHAVRVKLLEIYYSRKDLKSFERLASELYGMTSGEGEDWAQAASMGIVLDPANPLYAGGKAQEDFGGPALGSGTEPLEDLDPEALLGNSLSKDMLDSINIIDTASSAEEAPNELNDLNLDAGDHDLDPHALDFDLGIDEQTPALEQVPSLPIDSAPPVSNELAHEDPVVEFGTIDFESSNNVAPSIEQNAPEQELVSLDDLHFDLGESAAELQVSSNEEGSDLSLNSNEISFESAPDLNAFASSQTETIESSEIDAEPQVVNEAPISEAPAPEAFEFDLSGIDFNLNSNEPTLDVPLSEEHNEGSFSAEMATKLDLAVAYHEIGDKEGARELLDEVIKGGSPDQVEKAQGLLSQLV